MLIQHRLVATWLSADATKKKSTCFSCGSPDHMSADCLLRASSSIKHSASPCPVCNSPGHTARDCRQLAVVKHGKTGSKDDKYCRLYTAEVLVFVAPSTPIIMPAPSAMEATLAVPVFRHASPLPITCTTHSITTAEICEISHLSPRFRLYDP